MRSFKDDNDAKKLAKRWNFRPFRYKPQHGIIELLQIFATPWLTVQLHYIKNPDPTGMYHDHPWSFLSFILKGHYSEDVWNDPYHPEPDKIRTRRRFSLHKISNTEAHRITECDPATVTLFFAGPWVRDGLRFYANGADMDISRYVETDSAGKNVLKMR